MNYLYFSNLSKYKELSHFVATREVGNASFSVGDQPKNVIASRQKIAAHFKVTLDDFVVPGLVHGNRVVTITNGMRGMGAKSPDTVVKNTDAMITCERGILLMLPVADCVPILFYDPVHKALGIAHAGWRGTLKEIAKTTINKMVTDFSSKPLDIKVGMGPAICVKHYEVDEAVLPGAKGNYDLVSANKIQLLEAGVCEENIEIMAYCTYERTDMFFSHRAERQTGRFATGIMLK